jgi:hypothetical protein
MHKKHEIVKVLTVATLLMAFFALPMHAEGNCISYCESSFCSSYSSCAETTIDRGACDNIPEAWDSALNETKFPPKDPLFVFLPPHNCIPATDTVISKVDAITKHPQPNPLYSIIFIRAPPLFLILAQH